MPEPPPPQENPLSPVAEVAQAIINSTLDAIGRPALRDIYNATLGDRITAYRVTNLANVFRKYQEATKDLPHEGRRFVAEKVGIRLIEEASFDDNSDLQAIWANLLAAAVTKDRPEVTPRYISVARELTPDEAFFLRAVYDHLLEAHWRSSSVPKTSALPPASRKQSKDEKEDWIREITSHLVWLGVLEVARLAESNRPNHGILLTPFGAKFLHAAIEGAGSTSAGDPGRGGG